MSIDTAPHGEAPYLTKGSTPVPIQELPDRHDMMEQLYGMAVRAALAAGHLLTVPSSDLGPLSIVLREGGGCWLCEVGVDGRVRRYTGITPSGAMAAALPLWLAAAPKHATVFHSTNEPDAPGVPWSWFAQQTILPSLIAGEATLSKFIARQEQRVAAAIGQPGAPIEE